MILCANQLTGFYMRATLACKGLRAVTENHDQKIQTINQKAGMTNPLCNFPANKYLLKVNNTETSQGVNYVNVTQVVLVFLSHTI